MSAVQTTVTLVALTAVAIATVGTVTALLRRRADHLPLDVATRVAGVMERLPPETTDPRWIANEAEEQRPAGARIEVRAEDGRLLAAVGENFGLPRLQAGCADSGPVRACGARSAHFAVVAAAPHATDDAARRYLERALLAITVAAGLLVAALGRRLVRRGLRPLSQLAARIGGIEPGAGVRLPERSGFVELDAFASAFDDLLRRFEEALDRERRLAAQASHELRTPLTLARAEIEALGAPNAGTDSVARALKAVDRLSDLVEALLWFAKAQAPLDGSAMDIVNLADLVRAEVAARRRGGSEPAISCDLPDEVLVRGDERLLARVTANLVDNALKYGRGRSVEITAERSTSRVALSIVNATVLAEDVRPRLFEPFFRGSGATADATGFGLGLPFAREVARAHGGDITLDRDRTDDTAFVLTLPLVAWTDSSPATVDT